MLVPSQGYHHFPYGPCGVKDTKGDDVEGATFFSGREPGSDHSWGQGTGINAGVMLLAPSMADFLTMQVGP